MAESMVKRTSGILFAPLMLFYVLSWRDRRIFGTCELSFSDCPSIKCSL